MQARVAAGSPTCLEISVPPDSAIQLAVTQPNDLEFIVSRPTAKQTVVINGFDMGNESATFTEAGKYSVGIAAAKGKSTEFLMSLKSISLQKGNQYRKAEELATKSKATRRLSDVDAAIEAWRALGDLSAVGRLILDRGSILLKANENRGAMKSYEDSLRICHALNDTLCVAQAANNSGLTARRLGDFRLALLRLTEAAATWQKLSEPRSEGITFSNLALLHYESGDFVNALSNAERARTKLRPLDAAAHSIALNITGICYSALAEYGKARTFLEDALQEVASTGRKDLSARFRLNLGRAHLLEGANRAAETFLRRAQKEAAGTGDKSLSADIGHNLGQVLLALGRTQEAREELNRAIAAHRQLGDRRFEAAGLHHLGLAAAKNKEFAEARELLASAVSIRLECGLRDAAVESLTASVELEVGAREFKSARAFAERTLRLAESVRSHIPGPSLRAAYYTRTRKLFDLLVELETTPEASLLAAERGRSRALLDMLAEGKLIRPAPATLLARRAELQRSINLLALHLATEPPARQAEIRRQVTLLSAQDESLQAQMPQTSFAQSSTAMLTSLDRLQSQLPPDSALLEYHLGEKRSHLWVVTNSRVLAFPLPPRAEIEAQSNAAIELLSAILERKRFPAKQQAMEQAVQRLSATLLGSLKSVSLPRRLILAPDGILTQVPFAALLVSSNQRLGLVHDLLQTPSASYLASGRKPARPDRFPKRFLAIADPAFGGQHAFSRIPFSGEIDAATQLLKPGQRHILRGLEANSQALDSQPLRDFAVLHFSTHAIIDDQIPELSRIALSMVDGAGKPVDGFLRPPKLAAWTLNGSTVVLSACGTALGKQVLGEGLAGLTASLFHAGAAQLVLTLANIDAEASSEFFAQTYRNIFAPNPVSMEHALTLARRSLAASRRWQDPYYWAFIADYGRPSE